MSQNNGYKRFFDTLANKTRLDIIHALQDRPMNVGELTDKLSYEQSTISHNLNRLKTCRFVYCKKKGQERIYELNHDTIEPLLELMDEHVNKFCSKVCKKNQDE